MTKSKKKRKGKKSPRQLARANKKARDAEKRVAEEEKMARYLLENGWTRSGPLGDVWKHDTWQPVRANKTTEHGYVLDAPGQVRKVWRTQDKQKPTKSADTLMTLRQAYKAQQKLEAIGWEPAKTFDDDLADLL